jgi:pimeloyl-ACP methyl ester carboxylesterase
LQAPGALTAALNWYRATDGHRDAIAAAAGPDDAVSTPTLLVWGRNDPYVRRGAIDRAPRYMTGPYDVLELKAGHWLAQEAPREVAKAVLEHLAAH